MPFVFNNDLDWNEPVSSGELRFNEWRSTATFPFGCALSFLVTQNLRWTKIKAPQKICAVFNAFNSILKWKQKKQNNKNTGQTSLFGLLRCSALLLIFGCCFLFVFLFQKTDCLRWTLTKFCFCAGPCSWLPRMRWHIYCGCACAVYPSKINCFRTCKYMQAIEFNCVISLVLFIRVRVCANLVNQMQQCGQQWTEDQPNYNRTTIRL